LSLDTFTEIRVIWIDSSAFGVELGDVAELLLTRGYERIDGDGLQLGKMFLEDAAKQAGARLAIGMDATRGLGDDLVDAAKSGNFGRRDAHGFGSQLLMGGIAPHDGGAGLGGDDEIERVLKDQDAVCDGKCQRSAGTAFTADDGDGGHAEAGHLEKIAGDGFGLAALFGTEAGIGAGQIDEADDGAAELLGDFHAAESLAIALGVGHAEVALDALPGAAALAVADDHDLFIAQARHAAGDGLVVAIGAIPVNLAEIGEDPLDEVHGVGALGMTCPFDSDPGWGNGLRLVGSCCFLFAHFCVEPRPAALIPAHFDSTGRGRRGQMELRGLDGGMWRI